MTDFEPRELSAERLAEIRKVIEQRDWTRGIPIDDLLAHIAHLEQRLAEVVVSVVDFEALQKELRLAKQEAEHWKVIANQALKIRRETNIEFNERANAAEQERDRLREALRKIWLIAADRDEAGGKQVTDAANLYYLLQSIDESCDAALAQQETK